MNVLNKLNKDILRLFEQLHSLHDTIEEKANGFKSEKEGNVSKNNLQNLINESCSLEVSTMSQTVYSLY